MTVESPLRREAHGGFGERPGETDRQQCQHRAPGRLSLAAFADHGAGAAGEATGDHAAARQRRVEHRQRAHRGDPAGAGPAAPPGQRRRVLIRTDSGGGTHDFLTWLTSPGRRLHYSVGMTITEDMHQAILSYPGPGLGTRL